MRRRLGAAFILFALSGCSEGGSVGDPEAWQVSEEGRDFYKRSSKAWGEASRASGEDEETVARNIENTTQFYAPDPGATS